jgi:hypothetical protein
MAAAFLIAYQPMTAPVWGEASARAKAGTGTNLDPRGT